MTLPNADLNDLLYVGAIAEAGTLAGAARRLRVNHATIFRRLANLERSIGIPLFHREGGRYAPTAAGEALAALGATVSERFAETMRLITDEAQLLIGLVRITTTESIACGMIAPLLATARQKLPQIRLELNVTNEISNLSSRDADIAVRATNQPPDHLVGRKLCTLAHAVFGAPDYLACHRQRSLDELDWIAMDHSHGQTASVRWLARIVGLETVALRASSYTIAQRACRSGFGVAVLPCFIGDADPALERLGGPLADCATDLWLLTHRDLAGIGRVQAIIDLLARELGCHAGLIDGTARPAKPA